MVGYVYSLFFFTSVVAVLSEYASKNFKKASYSLIFILLVILAVFRDGNIMPDYKMYLDLFKSIDAGTNNYPIEFSYIILVKISNFIYKGNFLFFLALYAVLGVGLKLYLINRYSINQFYSLVLLICNFYLIQDLVQIRASVAIGLIYLGTFQLLDNKKKPFVVLILLASFFHFTSIVYLLSYYFSGRRFSKWKFILFIVFAYIFSFFGYKLLEVMVNIIPLSYVQLKLIGYLSGDRVSSLGINVFGIFIISKIILFLILLYFQHRLNSVTYNFLLKMYCSGILIYVGLSGVPDVAVRLSYVFFFSEIFLIPMMMLKVKPRIISNLLIIFFSYFLLYFNINSTSLFNYVN